MSKAATADSYSKNMLHQKVFRIIICILFCIIALLPFVLLVMNATRDSPGLWQGCGVSLIPSTHDREHRKTDDQAERYADHFAIVLCNHYESTRNLPCPVCHL